MAASIELIEALAHKASLEQYILDLSEVGPTGAYEQAEHELAIIEDDIAALKYREGQTDER